MKCVCGHEDHEHTETEPIVCKKHDCRCSRYQMASPDNPPHDDWETYKLEMYETEDKMRALLRMYPKARNMPNQALVFLFWKEFHGFDVDPAVIHRLTDTETITRTKRRLAEGAPEKYGMYDEKAIKAKLSKQIGIESWATERTERIT